MAMEARNALIKQTLISTVLLGIMMGVFYASAGHTDIPRARVFMGITFIYFLSSNIALYKLNPELLIQRLKVNREGSKTWDEALMRVCNLTAMILIPLVAGLDIGRYQWSSLGWVYIILGIILMIFSSVLINWAMIENPYFEPTVRIQEDREHIVISTGPYAIVRHPGYLSGIIWLASVPLILGSIYTFIPYFLYTLLMILRTYLEDKTLQEELPGYKEYTKKVRYRLFPGIW
jgi:protein-S-isoprenylcysteine O-methyltransferase Ste14